MGRKYNGSISDTFSQIAEAQYKRSDLVVPETTYLCWKKAIGFMNEKTCSEIGQDGVKRDFAIANFVDGEHKWAIKTTKCKHRDPRLRNDWRFIVSISCDGEEIMRSAMNIVDYETMSSKRGRH